MPLHKDRLLYRRALRLGVGRESALNLVLVARGLKDATTVPYSPGLPSLLAAAGLRREMDVSYSVQRIYGVIEHTSKIRLPGSLTVKRLYVTRFLSRERLRQLKGADNFMQGVYFGFPVCCILNYCHKFVREKKTYLDIFMDFLESLPCNDGIKSVDFRFMGGIAKYFHSIRVTEYIPCGPDCASSLELIRRNLHILGEMDPRFAAVVDGEFKKSVLIYGNKWESVGFLRLTGLKETGAHTYTARCLDSLPELCPAGKRLAIKLTPHRKTEIFSGGRRLAARESSRPLAWSYCFIVPHD